MPLSVVSSKSPSSTSQPRNLQSTPSGVDRFPVRGENDLQSHAHRVQVLFRGSFQNFIQTSPLLMIHFYMEVFPTGVGGTLAKM